MLTSAPSCHTVTDRRGRLFPSRWSAEADIDPRMVMTRSGLPTSPLARLSKREHEVLRHVAQDKTDREIASRLGIRERTARAHVSRIILKPGTASRVGAAVTFVDWPCAKKSVGMAVPTRRKSQWRRPAQARHADRGSANRTRIQRNAALDRRSRAGSGSGDQSRLGDPRLSVPAGQRQNAASCSATALPWS